MENTLSWPSGSKSSAHTESAKRKNFPGTALLSKRFLVAACALITFNSNFFKKNIKILCGSNPCKWLVREKKYKSIKNRFPSQAVSLIFRVTLNDTNNNFVKVFLQIVG